MDVKIYIGSRGEALELKYTRYQDGSTCKHGHTHGRYTRDNSCIECKRLSRYNSERKDPRAVPPPPKKKEPEVMRIEPTPFTDFNPVASPPPIYTGESATLRQPTAADMIILTNAVKIRRNFEHQELQIVQHYWGILSN